MRKLCRFPPLVHLVCPNLETHQRIGAKGTADGNIGSVAATGDQHASDTRDIIAGVEAATHPHFKTVTLIADQINRHANGQIAAHRCIEGDEDTFCCTIQKGRAGGDSIDDWLPVFGFPGLEVRRLKACLDKVALRLEPEQAWRPARDLASQYERGVEADITGCQVLAIALINFSHGVRYQHSGINMDPRPKDWASLPWRSVA
jgi:hypothetical protein